jgi:ABC-type sugar transport system permease subunit
VAEVESMTIVEKMKWIILPALLVIGVGVLEINFPHAMDGFDDSYTGRGGAGLIVLLFELFLWLTWGKIGGAIAILLGTIAIVICLFHFRKINQLRQNQQKAL